MEWLESIRRAVDCLEAHLLDADGGFDVAREVGVSPFHLQRGFAIMTGCTMAEYVRNRRLYLAALDVLAGAKVLDVALRYGYDTAESFAKAFSRFHGVTPTQLRREPSRLRVFLPLKITITISGGNNMDFIVEDEPAFTVIGFEREFSMETSYADIPVFWNEVSARHLAHLLQGGTPRDALEEAIRAHGIGMLGVCVDAVPDERLGIKNGMFRYLIAGRYTGGAVPKELSVHEFPAMRWAKFRCTGPLPGALQAVNTKIFREWLPGNSDWELASGASIEYYGPGDMSAADYRCAIWIPVRARGRE